MKRIMGIIGVGVVTALAMPTVVHAQGKGIPGGAGLPLTINLAATVTLQSADTVNDNGKTTAVTSKTTTVKFTQADIIKTVEQANLATPTKNAILQVGRGIIRVIDGTNTFDASHFVSITFDPDDNGVWTGNDSTNDVTGDETQSYTGHYVIGFDFERGGGDFISAAGLATEVYSIGPKNKAGTKALSDSVSVTFAGEGQTSGANGSVIGTLKSSAKGTTPQ
jgi:hypothetical protein